MRSQARSVASVEADRPQRHVVETYSAGGRALGSNAGAGQPCDVRGERRRLGGLHAEMLSEQRDPPHEVSGEDTPGEARILPLVYGGVGSERFGWSWLELGVL
jgi:hypothetical protein